MGIVSYTVLALILFAVALILADMTIRWNRLRKRYNQAPLSIATFEGSDSPYHPSVLYFEERWNGYAYWMAETPYSPSTRPYRDRWECPSIHVSTDGLHWTQADGRQPLDDFGSEGEANLDYFSDPHLVFHDGRLECWYRITRRTGITDNRSHVSLLRRTTEDGVHWTEREVLLDDLSANPADKSVGRMIVSPAVIREAGVYRMWFVDSEALQGRRIACSTSPDARQWSDRIECRLVGAPTEIDPWHIDVSKVGSVYWLVCYDFRTLTLWSSEDGIEFSYVRELLRPSRTIGSFYEKGLYRASLVKYGEGYRLYFSADGFDRTYIGIMEGASPSSLRLVAADGRRHCSIPCFVKQYVLGRIRAIRFILKHL